MFVSKNLKIQVFSFQVFKFSFTQLLMKVRNTLSGSILEKTSVVTVVTVVTVNCSNCLIHYCRQK